MNAKQLYRDTPVFLSLPRLLIAIGVVIALGYTAFVAYPLAEGPKLTVDKPIVTDHNTTIISGTTERVSELSINGLDTPLSENGAFAVERSFPPGYTVVVLEARDRFRRVRTETLTFITEPNIYASEENSEKETGSEESDNEVDVQQ